MKNLKIKNRTRRRKRIRAKVKGDASCPRLAIFKSNKYLYAQIIDDNKGVTIAAVSDKKSKGKTKTERSMAAGLEIAKMAKDKKIDKVVFDRGGFIYTGRVKALATGAREGGLKF
ncbi:MAG: 50S ribosomal protein L18 [Patescibacteria group bacterium]